MAYGSNIKVMEKKMETTIVYWGNIGVIEKKMETTIVLYIVGFEVWDLGFRGGV